MILLLSSLCGTDQVDVKCIDLSKIDTTDPTKLDNKLFVENDKLGFIIKKNPKKGMILRKLHNGMIAGYYFKNRIGYYNMYFHDYHENSYGSTYDYLNIGQYVDPHAVIDIISEIISTYKKKSENDHDFKNINTLEISMVMINCMTTVKKILNEFNDIIITFEEYDNNYRVIIKTIKSICYLLNFTIMLFSIISVMNTITFNSFKSKKICFEKLINCVNVINAPYFTRYIISSRLINNKDFVKFKTSLENWNDHQIQLNFGNTAIHRRNFISNYINFNNPIIDIGCGDGFYAIPFSKKLNNKKYYAYDINVDELEKLSKKIKKDEIDNIDMLYTWEDFNKIDKKNKYDIIIVEVIEHMEKETSIKFLIDIINYFDSCFDNIIITTPNYTFNKHYSLETKYRHYDHKYELTEKEFVEYINQIILKTNLINRDKYSVIFYPVGDIIDNVSCSQCVIIKKK